MNYVMPNFPVVGIVGGAGALDSILLFLRNYRATTGMALILLLKGENKLAELLLEATKLTVASAEDGLPIKPNYLYICSNAAQTTIGGGSFRVSPFATAAKSIPADILLESLGENIGKRAIGVLLSGSGSDGLAGLKKIQDLGGVTFVQSERSCRFKDLSRNAQKAGIGDFYLSPEDIAKEIGILATRGFDCFRRYVEEKTQSRQDEDCLDELLVFIRKSTQVDLRNYRRDIISDRIRKRMEASDCRSIGTYIDHLRTHPLEMETLTQNLLLHQPKFFSDPELYDALSRRAFPKITAGNNREVRVWVPACSSGEEVYSLAISLMEFIAARPRLAPVDIQMFGTDISESAIHKARSGMYPHRIASDISPDLLKKYFMKTNDGYRINGSIRDLCVFAKHDVTKEIPFRRIDLIDCRNLLIFFDSVLRKRILPVFHNALNPSGFIMVDNTDGFMSSFPDYFFPADNKHKIYAKETPALKQELEVNLDSPRANAAAGPKEQEKPGFEKQILKLSDELLLSRYGPPSVIVNENFDILQFRGRISPYIEPVSGEASLNLTKMAHPGLLIEILALLHQAKKNKTSAAKEIRSGDSGGDAKRVSIEVIPILTAQFPDKLTHFTIVFRDLAEQLPQDKSMKKRGASEMKLKVSETKAASPVNEYLQSIIEQLEVANQELRAMNQELAARLEEYELADEQRRRENLQSRGTKKDLRISEEEVYKR